MGGEQVVGLGDVGCGDEDLLGEGKWQDGGFEGYGSAAVEGDDVTLLLGVDVEGHGMA